MGGRKEIQPAEARHGELRPVRGVARADLVHLCLGVEVAREIAFGQPQWQSERSSEENEVTRQHQCARAMLLETPARGIAATRSRGLGVQPQVRVYHRFQRPRLRHR